MRPITGITKEKVILTENNIPREIVSLIKDERPASVAILLDKSSLVSQQKRTLTANWFAQFIAGSNPSNEYILIGYDTAPETMCDWGCDAMNLLDALRSGPTTTAKRKTALYDACLFALDKMNGRTNSKRVLLIFSDGLDNGSKASYGQLRSVLKQSSALLYEIAIISDAERLTWKRTTADYVMELASVTSGMEMQTLPSAGAMENTANLFSGVLRNQYVLSFKLTGEADHKLHPITIKFAGRVPEATALTPEIYLRIRPEFYDQ